MNKISLALLMAAALSACSPQYDWRDYRSNDAPYAVMFPGKPASQTRAIKLDNLDVNMTMTAAEVDGVVFAVGSAQLADAARTPAAADDVLLVTVAPMFLTSAVFMASSAAGRTALDVEAKGSRNGEPMLLIGRFIAKDTRTIRSSSWGGRKTSWATPWKPGSAPSN